jgi:enterochelin esterase-like enzyme
VVSKNLTFFFLFLFFLSGCKTSAVIPTPTDINLFSTPEATLLTEKIATHEPLSDKEDCSSSGVLERYQIDSVLLNEPLFFNVYYPPCYDPNRVPGYPVLYALHGQNFNDTMWVDLGLVDIADRLIHAGELPAFVTVMPYEENYFRGSDVNNFPSAVTEEIIPWIENTLNVCEEKKCRAIGGISRGASWAMRIGLSEWDMFGAIGSHSLPTFRGDISNLPLWLEKIPFGEEPRIYIDTGRFDPEVKSTYRFESVLSEKGIPHEWHLNEGRHNEEYWEAQMEAYLRWYCEVWN